MSHPKALIRSIRRKDLSYKALMFVCPGCAAGGPDGYDGLHLLAINTEVYKPSWFWNGDLIHPTLSPSILTSGYSRCHSYLTNGVFNFLSDSDHPLAGQMVEIPELPEWSLNLE